MAASATKSVTSSTFSSLGAAPVLVQNLGPAPVTIAIADSTPTTGTAGFVLAPGAPFLFDPADASSNIYVALFSGPSTIAYSVISSQTG